MTTNQPREVYVIAYDVPHRKSQDVLLELKTRGIGDVTVMIQSFIKRPNFSALVPHRPQNCRNILTRLLCKRLDYKFIDYRPEISSQFILIAGARILPEAFTKNNIIINAHPGLLPEYRGLDALKWAIYNHHRVGVAIHLIDEKIDAGKLIRQEKVPVYSWDTFHSFAYRQYDLEIKMLVDSIEEFREKKLTVLDSDSSKFKVHRRMPNKLEKDLLKRFDKFKEEYAVV
jgi:folate-dependent phosphoribosylglycinamide formyltransferase PurN